MSLRTRLKSKKAAPQAPASHTPAPRGTIASLFSGGGGWEVGASFVGLRPVWAVEHRRDVADIYEANHLHTVTVEDALAVDYSRLERPDVLVASPPCQAYSTARTSSTPRDDDEVGIALVTAAQALKPNHILLENVYKYQKAPIFLKIKDGLRKLGYNVDERLVESTDFGVPQSRRRLIMRASLQDLPVFRMSPNGATWYSVIKDLIPSLKKTELAGWQKDKIPEGNTDWLLVHGACAGAGHSQITRPSSEPSWTITASNRSMGAWKILSPDGTAYQPTPRVMARWQTFPDQFILPTNKELACTVVGQSVPPSLAHNLLKAFFP